MASENLIKTSNIDVTVRELDFVTQFNRTWEALRNLLGIMRPIKKQVGTRLVSYQTYITLADGNVAEGNEIPYSAGEVIESKYADVNIRKYRKGVSIEAVNKYGAGVAVRRTDEEFRTELQLMVLKEFYDFVKTGTLGGNASTWQAALAKAQGLVIDKFNKMRKTVTQIVGFANVLDAYDYLGSKDVSIQSKFGISYVEDFLGYKTLFLLSEPDIPQGMVIAVPTNNIDLYYIDPNDADFKALGLNYTVSGETNLIGYHVEGEYKNATGDMFALMGMKLWAEYLDGIGVVLVDANPLAGATITAPAGTKDIYGTQASAMQTGITISGNKITGTLKYLKTGAPAADWGKGNFLTLCWDNIAAGATSFLCGLVPSEGTGLVEGINETGDDKFIMMKITDAKRQKVTFVSSATGKRTVQEFDISGLVCEKE